MGRLCNANVSPLTRNLKWAYSCIRWPYPLVVVITLEKVDYIVPVVSYS